MAINFPTKMDLRIEEYFTRDGKASHYKKSEIKPIEYSSLRGFMAVNYTVLGGFILLIAFVLSVIL